jgi:Spy/CpxP family protein refolding chaperone
MRKGLIATVLLTTALLLGPAPPGFARGPGGWGHGGSGAGHASGAWHGNGSFRWHRGAGWGHAWGGWHGGGGVGVVIGPGVGWGDPWGWGPPGPYYGYPYDGSPSYLAPPVLVQAAPPVDIQQEAPAPQAYLWYYCQNPPGYYPYVKDCPAGWMTVVPPMGAGPPGTRQARPSVFADEGPLITIILSHGQELGLTPEQSQKLQELRTTFEQEAVARGADIRAAEADLNALLAKDQWDLPAIQAKVQQLATQQGDLRFARLKTLAAGRALLTPEQLQKLKTIAQWTRPPGRPERMGPSQPSAPSGPAPLPPAPGASPAPRQ